MMYHHHAHAHHHSAASAAGLPTVSSSGSISSRSSQVREWHQFYVSLCFIIRYAFKYHHYLSYITISLHLLIELHFNNLETCKIWIIVKGNIRKH